MFKPVNDAEESFDLLFKLVLIGDAGVGKTCLVQRFMGGAFVEKHSSTIGVDFTMKTLTVDGRKIKLQIWDTAGQERFRTITQSYYRSANGVVLAYDTTRRETFDNCTRWLEDVKKYATPNAIILLVGNKIDLAEMRAVPREVAEQFRDQNRMIGHVETSAKDNNNIEDAFVAIARELKNMYGGSSLGEGRSSSFNLSGRPVSRSLRSRCCDE